MAGSAKKLMGMGIMGELLGLDNNNNDQQDEEQTLKKVGRPTRRQTRQPRDARKSNVMT